MTSFSVGDPFVVTDPKAPFVGYAGVVTAIEDGTPFPVVTEVTYMGNRYPVAYTVQEITPVRKVIPVVGVPVMGT